MAVFMIAEVKVTDDSWIPDYAAKVHDIVHKHGGRYLSRSANITPLEGTVPDLTLVAILQFPTVEAVKAFANDPAYAPFAKARQAGTVSSLFIIDDTDVAGTIPYLTKAG